MKIKSVAWLHVENSKGLCVKSKGRDKFYLPGGKIEAGESLIDALCREIQEELCISLIKPSIQRAVTINAQAHGHPAGTNLEMHCFYARFDGEMVASSEIEVFQFIGSEDLDLCAPAAKKAIKFLIANKAISKNLKS